MTPVILDPNTGWSGFKAGPIPFANLHAEMLPATSSSLPGGRG